jgi:riboflavin biosynthesis pyrimidine reductase
LTTTVIGAALDLPPLELLFEAEGSPAFDLPERLTLAYGGSLGFPEPRLYANFVASLDGVVALPGVIRSNRMIAAYSEADRFVMGLLRATADVVLVGAGTMRSSLETRWTAQHAYAPGAPLFAELRRTRRQAPRPMLAVLTGSGSVDPRHPALEEGALLLTGERGAARLRGHLPSATTVLALGSEAHVDPVVAVEALRNRGHQLILAEGGPTTLGALVRADLVDELFLTSSPLLAGRSSGRPRPALVEGTEFLPATSVDCRLLTLRRAESHLFARYQLSRSRPMGVTAAQRGAAARSTGRGRPAILGRDEKDTA